MSQDLRRHAPDSRRGTAFLAAKLAFALLGFASVVLLAWLAVPLSRDILESTVPGLLAAVRRYLVPPYIFLVVNIIVFAIWLLSCTKTHHHLNYRKDAPGLMAVVAAPSADPPKPPKDLPHSSPAVLSTNVWHANASFASLQVSSPRAGEASPGAWSDESSLTVDFEGDSVTSTAAVTTGIFPKSVAEIGARAVDEATANGGGDDNDSLDATWKAITEGKAGRRHLKDNQTRAATSHRRLEPAGGGPANPPRHLEPASEAPALRREMKRPENTRQPTPPSPSPTPRRILERRVNNTETPTTADDATFEDFIQKSKDKQREESATWRRMGMLGSTGY